MKVQWGRGEIRRLSRERDVEMASAALRTVVAVLVLGTRVDGGRDEHFMEMALELAGQGRGETRPNPTVGCIIVDDDDCIVGKGFHPKAGSPHAEIFALKMAKDKARNATAYVTLEPCNHYGRTPPCVDALVTAGVRKVVAGMVDPDPRTAGRGLKRLEENGVEVVIGVKEKECREAIKGFVFRMQHGRPQGIWHLVGSSVF